MSEVRQIRAPMSFGAFAIQLLSDKTYLTLLLTPLFYFAYGIQGQLNTIRDTLVDKDGKDRGIKVDLVRLKETPSGGNSLKLTADESDTINKSEEEKTEGAQIFAQYITEHHPTLKFLLEVHNMTSDFMYYWGLLVVLLAVALIGVFIMDSII